jgi:hypothetical protein
LLHSNIWILIGLREHRYYGTHCTIMFNIMMEKKKDRRKEGTYIVPATNSISQMMTIGDATVGFG